MRRRPENDDTKNPKSGAKPDQVERGAEDDVPPEDIVLDAFRKVARGKKN